MPNNIQKQKYRAKLKAMDDRRLESESEDKIWLSAYASNNRRSDYHWQADACFDEAESRGKEHIYSRALKAAQALA